jgi:hypothetical protein
MLHINPLRERPGMSHYLVDHAAQLATFKLSLKIAKAACPTSRATSSMRPTPVKPQAQVGALKSRRSVRADRSKPQVIAHRWVRLRVEIGEKTLKV